MAETTQDNVTEDIGLTDVMLAMDVVDTLRHEQRMVAQALNDEAREQALIERVRKAYASQGIAVSDAMIAEGVAQLKEQEYHYDPPSSGLYTRFLTAWVNRGQHARSTGFFAGLAGIIALAWYGLVGYPQSQQLTREAASLNNAVIVAETERQSLTNRHARLTRQLDSTDDATIEVAGRRAFDVATRNAQQSLDTAMTSLTAAITHQKRPTLDEDNLEARRNDVQRALDAQTAELASAKASLDQAEQSIDQIAGLGALPATLALLRDEARELAASAALRDQAGTLYARGIDDLNAGNLDAANEAVNALESLIERMRQSFSVRIVSRPGEYSGVIREPPNNRSASNYYIVVEAVTPAGDRIAQRITSEEDSSVKLVRKWGVRVDKAQFDRVRQDKSDDGIVQRAEIGTKARGEIDVQYSVPVSGGTIHTWEEF
ncbi:MAG: DUF6384 family protein [Pseudomonadota bacterium]